MFAPPISQQRARAQRAPAPAASVCRRRWRKRFSVPRAVQAVGLQRVEVAAIVEIEVEDGAVMLTGRDDDRRPQPSVAVAPSSSQDRGWELPCCPDRTNGRASFETRSCGALLRMWLFLNAIKNLSSS